MNNMSNELYDELDRAMKSTGLSVFDTLQYIIKEYYPKSKRYRNRDFDYKEIEEIQAITNTDLLKGLKIYNGRSIQK